MTDGTDTGIRFFKRHLQEELGTICSENGWDYDNLTHRGYALQHWVAVQFRQADPGIDTDPATAVLSSKDLGADVVLEDPTRQHLRIVQCKASSLGKESKLEPLNEQQLNDFFARHSVFMDRQWVRTHGSENAFVLLGDYRDQIKKGWTAEFFFVTTLPATARHQELTATWNTTYQRQQVSVTCQLLDLHALKDFHNHIDSIHEPIAERISIDLPTGLYVVKDQPFRTLLAIVKGNTLRNLYKKHREALFTYNIRDFLGKARAINRKMIETAERFPAEFFYYNNGVSAVCSQFEIDDDKLIATRLQIINGAQTIGALHAADDNPEIQVLFRLTESDKSRLNEQIIRFNNTQNTINSSDFRANDAIQVWLEKQFDDLKPRGHLPPLRYSRKRSYKRSKGATVVTLEEFAKVQYAFLYEPTIIYDNPKQLWTYQSEGGRYEQAFGIDDELPNDWPPERLDTALVALALYLRISETATADMQEDAEQWYVKRLRYHLLSLAGLLVRHRRPPVSASSLLRDDKAFASHWDEFWEKARQTLITNFETARSEQMTLSAFARSTEKWDQMQRQFCRVLKLPTADASPSSRGSGRARPS